MKIKIFYPKNLNDLNLPAVESVTHTLEWEGELTELDIKSVNAEFAGKIEGMNGNALTEEDAFTLLEAIFNLFNIGKRPARASGMISLSPGSVVAIDNRAYHCKPIGWKLIGGFLKTTTGQNLIL